MDVRLRPMAELQQLFPAPVQIMIAGDTHYEVLEYREGVVVLNSGSPTFPASQGPAAGDSGTPGVSAREAARRGGRPGAHARETQPRQSHDAGHPGRSDYF